MKKITLLALWALFLVCCFPAAAQGVVINEILASNNSINTDEDGSYEDWVELYNTGSSPVNLNGYGLSDSPATPFKWIFPNVTLNAGEYLLIWCSDKNRTTPGSPLHTNWKISASGEAITLTDASGVTVDQSPAAELQSDQSFGRLPNGTGPFVIFTNVTPGAVNASAGTGAELVPPVFSHNAGFYTSAFNLSITSADPEATIIYTLDGSDPDENNLNGTTYQYKNSYSEQPFHPTGPFLTQGYTSHQYSAPIQIVDRTPQTNKLSWTSSTYSFDPSYYFPDNPVFKGTVVKARAIKPGSVSSPIVTRTYFVHPSGSARYNLPVISLAFPETRFFDYYDGIYVAGVDYDNWRALNPNLNPRGREVGNYYRRGQEFEKGANFSYFVNGTEVLNQEVGLRIRGASTRRYESKSLTVYARSEYGDGTLSHQFFPDLADDSFKRLTLSMSGSDFKDTMFRDALVHRICRSLKCENENYQPTVTFFNGEYWGILNIRERFDNDYFERVYNIDEVDLLENQGIVAEEGDTAHFQAMVTYLQNNSLANPANYEYIKTQLDPESFTDNFVTNIFLDNSDWPGNNQQFWRKKTAAYEPNAPYGHDGRWRWVFHDLDDTFSFGTDDYAHNNLEIATTLNNTWPNPEWSTLIIRKLLENESYKEDFISRFADLMNTIFKPDYIIGQMNELKAGIQPSMPEHIARWSFPSSMNSWNNRLTYQQNFALERPAYQREHIRAKFNISNDISVTLNVSSTEHGHIKINTIDLVPQTDGVAANPYPWNGLYYADIPVKLKAIAKPGYVFSHWTGASDSTNPELTMVTDEDFSLTAVFVPLEPVQIEEPIYFWHMTSAIPNDTPLTTLSSTYELLSDATIQYQSCLEGYPFIATHPLWRKASMERRNAPTPVNYRPAANNNAPYNASQMRGLQILQPFQNNGLENTMVFNMPTTGFKSIKFSFAAKDEGAASAIVIDYSVNAGAPVWITTGLSAPNMPLTSDYTLFETDFSAITSAENNPNFKVRIRFTGPNMTIDEGDRVTFNNIALDGVRMPVTYPTPLTFTQGVAITPVSPAISGGTVLSFSISPGLPVGLNFDTATGIISGTPTVASAAANYTVTANYSGGSVTFEVQITINEAAPIALSYPSPNTFTVGAAITPLSPTVTGSVSSYSISPNLPAGLSFNTATGVISGTPTVISATGTYTVTATNSGGSTTFGVVITVNDAAPVALSYNSPNTFTIGVAIAPLSPTVTGTVNSWSISPNLPSGLTFDTVTGVISGTPTAVSATQTYTVTATNSGGSTTFGVVITVNDAAPVALSYDSPNTFTIGTAIAPLSPTVTGTVNSWSISPNLPSGLTFNTVTGVISGTPTAVSATETYTVTATNSGGSTTFGVVITVNDAAPVALSYNSPNTFTVGAAIAPLSPTVTGTVTTWSISPNLPAGLSFNTATGVISGTPTVISATGTYTVTATNSGGSATFGVVITVNDAAPVALLYNSPNTFTVGTAVTPLSPNVTGTVSSWNISPSLPAGLAFNTATGVISGTPSAISATETYTVTATNSGGSATFGVVITVNDAVPVALSYNSPNTFTVGTAITPLSPTVTGTVSSWNISPSLPAGLSFDTATGVISGTPTTIAATETYTVTATNSGGSATFGVVITVNDSAPVALSYNSPNTFTVGAAIAPLSPTVTGTVTTWSISPNLPAGLTFNTTTGVISGTPNVISATGTYTVTATNSGGSATFGVVITVNDAAPVALSYTSPNTFTVGTAITPLSPTVTGSVSSYSISPNLPAGLSFDTATGVISGTPTVISATGTYTVTATNSGGSTTFGVVITVNDAAPVALSYTSPNTFTVGTAITPLSPTVSGTVSSYSISPNLPSGLAFDTATGVISGAPAAISATQTYTVTATNSGGSATFGVVITVNDAAPVALSYNSPNTFTVGVAITPLSPTVTGSVSSYSISTNLPAGLSFDTATGVISGTPTTIAATENYTVTATNSGGSTTFGVVITVNDSAPVALSYNSPNTFTVGTAIAPLSPTVTGSVSSYSISPNLPSGLAFDTATGVISGTPTVISATETYTVTATNSGGSTTFGVVITVNDAAPVALSYNSPNTFTVGAAITPLSPTVTGTVSSWSISPSLPAGLSFDTATGVISGTPSAISATETYTVTATNSGGSTTFGVVITVNDSAPVALSYNSPNTFTVGAAITPLSPTVTGSVSSYSISPNLPAGLSFDTATGVISGTPNAISATETYTVTATNSGGSTTFGVVITVNDAAPVALSYNSPNTFIVGAAIAPLSPTVTGTVTTWSISPNLPAGLSFDTATGVISGTPTAISATETYTVTATNSGGSATFGVVITVNDAAPVALSYNSPNTFTVGAAITPLSPTVTGTVTSWSISPNLPVGLSFNTATGVISGTPTAISATETYTVTATNSGGSTTFGVVITVNDAAPVALSYNSPNTFTVGTTISPLSPTVTGSVSSYSISPNLPIGLSFNTATGVISGTPTAISATETYTVTATNSGGSTTFGVVITVNDAAPVALSYNSPNTFTVGTTISPLSPTVTGSVSSYSISPNLPTGLSFNTATGVISGTPIAISATETYTVTATNSGGSTTFGVVITVNDAAPVALSYTSPNTFTVGTAITPLSPTVSGTVSSYSISPNLPAGLSFDTATGVISGTPTTIAATQTYTVTATNTGGSATFGVVITVNDAAPVALSYNSPNTFTVGAAITPLSPTVTGTVTTWSISPNLPAGLTFDTATGVISGTPTVISATGTYTVTATNSGGSATFGVVITVNDAAPVALSYNSPNIFTVGTAITPLSPTVTGTVTTWSISPNLPAGLSFNTATGVISGTPTAISATETYTVTATNTGGTTTFGVVITVNDAAPVALSYNSPNTFIVGAAISPLSPTVTGSVASYSISPNLPAGLSFDTATGVISGTPSAISATETYTVTATNSGGSATFGVVITVNDAAPVALSYNSPNTFTVGTAITPLSPTVTGTVSSWSVSPSLPAGLSFDTATGVISGTPTVISATGTYTVTATNSGGSATFGVVITVNDAAPVALSYNSPNTFTVGTAIAPLSPTVTGSVSSYSISPNLPAGLAFNTATGVISGTPSVISTTETYTVTATNSGGSTTFGVVITVVDVAPFALAYNSPNTFVTGFAITPLTPSVAGNVELYTVSPALPGGLVLNSVTGEITGTPTNVTAMSGYTITATNSGGSASFQVMIEVIDNIPAVSYIESNVYTIGQTIAPLIPSTSGTGLSFSIEPQLPAGLTIDPSTGYITGTPSQLLATTNFTVTAVNASGSATAQLFITVNDIAPSNMWYASPNVFNVGTEITPLLPTVTGNVSSYSITPELPAGLIFSTATGAISGTPTEVSPTASYTVMAFNTGGNTTFDVIITVLEAAPHSLLYDSPHVFHVNSAIEPLLPTVSGNVTHFTVEPPLPSGLVLDFATGQISGIPTITAPESIYTVTAHNTGGSVSFGINITVEDELGVPQNPLDAIVIYPNPFAEIIYFNIQRRIQFDVFSAEGKWVRSGMSQQGSVRLDGLSAGTYLLVLKDGSEIVTRKIVRE